MWTLQISIMCLVFATWPDPIELSSPDDQSPGFSRREKLPIRRHTQHPSRQSSTGPSTSSQPSQIAVWELSLSADRYLQSPEFHSSSSHSNGTEHPPAMYSGPATTSAPDESSLRSRSRSPPGNPPSYSTLFGTKIKDIRFQRYFPQKNSSRELVIRLYDFRPGTQIYLRDQHQSISEPLTGVQYILSGVNGDAFALVERRKTFQTTLRGLYMPPGPRGSRAKINIFTHHISLIETEEANEIPLGRSTYKEYLTRKTVDVPVEPFFPTGPTSYSIPLTFKVFGIQIEELPFYRFFPVRNPSWELGIKLYSFDPGLGIYLRIKNNKPDPEKLTGVQYTLSDVNGNAFALVQKLPNGSSIIRGLYLPETSRPAGVRVTINVFTDSVRKMDEYEVYATQLGKDGDIRKWYDIRHVGVRFAPSRKAR